MKNFKVILALLSVVSLMLSFTACASKSTEEEPASETKGVSSADKVSYGFEGSLENWCISTWESETESELGCTNVAISTDQKASGSSSAAVTCDFKENNESAKTTKGAFKINYDNPINLKGKLLTAKVFIPEELVSEKFKSAPIGVKLYIKTTKNYSWSDGGSIDIANTLKPGWNEISFAPIDVNESDTREIGIQITKAGGSPGWNGTIYIDDVSY